MTQGFLYSLTQTRIYHNYVLEYIDEYQISIYRYSTVFLREGEHVGKPLVDS
jgi:hypothetical protein